MYSTPLARDYDVPKRPVFHLEEMEVVQSTDASAFVSCSVTDSVMFGTNGNIGLRHRGEVETVGFTTDVMLNGVYHTVPFDSKLSCTALPRETHIGASLCRVSLDCIVDGESGTLFRVPTRRLSLLDGAYRSGCADVMSADGGLVFDCDYVRAVSSEDLRLWGAEVTYTNFTLASPSLSASRVKDSSEPSEGSQVLSDECEAFPASGSYHPHMTSADPNATYRLEFVATLAVDIGEWDVLRTEQTDDVRQRSLTSGILATSVFSAVCTVGNGDSVVRLSPEVEIIARSDASPDEASNLSHDLYGPNTYMGGGHEMKANRRESHHTLYRHRMGLAYHGAKETQHYVIKKRFSYTLTRETIPEFVTLTWRARHFTENVPCPRTFPAISDIIETRRKSLAEFWKTYDIDLQLQDEVTPNRMRLALLFNAFSLFCVSPNLENGLPRSGCSFSGQGLQYALGQYLYHGMYYTLTRPSAVLALLKSLHRLLPQTRLNAHHMSLTCGALYPMHTMTGSECQQYLSFNTARFHINAEIGYLVCLYFEAVDEITVTDRFMLLELMLETARVWPQLGEWLENGTLFRLDNIAGGDEYNSSSSGNFYIHLSVRRHLANALDILEQQERLLGAERMNPFLQRIKMSRDDLDEFRRVVDAIEVPSRNRFGVYMVHDYFETLAAWKGARPVHPLYLNYHPLAIYRQKLVDIPEVLLAMFLYPDSFDRHEFEKNLTYYQSLCTFDSPEALGVVTIMQCRARGSFAQPLPLLRSLVSLDLDNIIHSAEEGLHYGAMSSSLVSMICGIGGVSFFNRSLYLNPILPAGAAKFRFTVCWRGAVLRTTLESDALTYELVSGDNIRFIHGDLKHRIHLHAGFPRCQAVLRLSIPRVSQLRLGQFDGAIFQCDSLFDSNMDCNYEAWNRTLETFFDNYRSLHHRDIPSLTPEEFIESVIYQNERTEIVFSGIHNVLCSRGIELELGSLDDAEIVETRFGLANAKVSEMAELLERDCPKVNSSILSLLKDFTRNGVSLAVVSYHRNLKQLLSYNRELNDLFIASIDGEEAHDRQIRGRPHIDLYSCAARKIHVHPSRCIVFAGHLDRDYCSEDMAQFRMFLDVEDPFVTRRTAPRAYPQLSPDAVERLDRDNPVVCPLQLSNMPTTIDDVEDIVCGRLLPDRLMIGDDASTCKTTVS